LKPQKNQFCSQLSDSKHKNILNKLIKKKTVTIKREKKKKKAYKNGNKQNPHIKLAFSSSMK
jgi:hypothetical protein